MQTGGLVKTNVNFISRKICPACGSGAVSNLVSVPYDSSEIKDYLAGFYASTGGVDYKYLDSENFALDKCADCALVFQREIPGDELSQILYDEWIDKEITKTRQQNKDLNYFLCVAQEIVSLIEHFDRIPSSLRFLDFGMGWGNWCRMAKGFGIHADGMELSEERIIAAKESGIRITDWNDLPGSGYDFINTDRVFEHLPEPLDMLKHLASGLAGNGLIKINVPEGLGIEKAIAAWNWNAPRDSELTLNAVSPLEHLNCYQKDTLIRMAGCAGLEPVNLRKSQSVKAAKNSCWAQNKTATNDYWGDTYLFFRKKSADA